jgi:flagella basal body P-ring formation protein FlgA
VKWILLAIMACFLSLAHAKRAEVRVAELSTVRLGEPIRLSSLLTSMIADADLNEKASQLVIFEPLTVEGEASFRSQDLVLALRQKLSFQDLQRLSLKVPEKFTVRAQRNFIAPADIRTDVMVKAQSICAECTIEFQDLRVPELKISQEILRTRLDTQSLKGPGSFLLPLTVETSNGRSVHWVTGQLRFSKIGPVARRMISVGESIAARDYELKKIDITFAKDGVAQEQDLAGKVASRNIALGQGIFAGDLKKEIAALRGQPVKILIGNESFEVSTSGIAQEGGSVGDMIKVKSLDTQKILSGLLVEKGTVRVE